MNLKHEDIGLDKAILYCNPQQGCILDIAQSFINSYLTESDVQNKDKAGYRAPRLCAFSFPKNFHSDVSLGSQDTDSVKVVDSAFSSRPRKTKDAAAARNQTYAQLQRQRDEISNHKLLSKFLWPIVDTLKEAWKASSQNSLFLGSQSCQWYHNKEYGQCMLSNRHLFQNHLKEIPESSQSILIPSIPIHCVNICNRLYSNDQDHFVTLKVIDQGLSLSSSQSSPSTTFFIPLRSQFLLSDISYLTPLVDNAAKLNGHDLIVLDPPWPSKAVRRSSSYTTFTDIYNIFQIPFKQLASSRCLVCIWTTNNPKHQRFVQNRLLPDWGLRIVGEWYWIKITPQGNEIFPRHGSLRRPYEKVYIAASPTYKTDFLPHHYAIIGVPVGHSRKPRLEEILKQFGESFVHPLELFARNMAINTTSWGNEVLYFQEESFI